MLSFQFSSDLHLSSIFCSLDDLLTVKASSQKKKNLKGLFDTVTDEDVWLVVFF